MFESVVLVFLNKAFHVWTLSQAQVSDWPSINQFGRHALKIEKAYKKRRDAQNKKY